MEQQEVAGDWLILGIWNQNLGLFSSSFPEEHETAIDPVGESRGG